MALTWDVTKIKDYQTYFPDVKIGEDTIQWNGTLQTLVWYCLFLGMPNITEQNKDEWYFRSKVYDHLFGAVGIDKDGNHQSIPYEVVCQAVGLHTNVSPETRAAWLKRVVKNYADDVQREVSREKRAIDNPVAV